MDVLKKQLIGETTSSPIADGPQHNSREKARDLILHS